MHALNISSCVGYSAPRLYTSTLAAILYKFVMQTTTTY